MIPLKLQIKNFLSYGSSVQTIDFGHYNLICLSGKNGHGKSALLDALTWALWGQARKLSGNARADQGLLRLGQTQMMVCLDFECNGQAYRIKREFMQTYGKPVTLLEFGFFDPSHDKFVPLTEKTIRDTQAKIDQMLHLTFDAFVNSAFLRQGQANEFSKKSPKERKDVLASILGLDRYEAIRRLAGERIKQTNTYKIHLSTLNTKLEQELAHATIIAQQLNALNQQQHALMQQEQSLEQEKANLYNELLANQKAQQQYALVKYQFQQLTTEQHSLRQQLQNIFNQWRTVHKQQLHAIDFSKLEQQKKDYVDRIKNHQQILQDQLVLKQELLMLKETATKINQEFHEKKSIEINTKKISIERLLAEKNHVEISIKDSKAKLSRLEQENANYKDELNKNPQENSNVVIQMRIGIEKRFEKRKEHYQRWITQANIIKTELVTNEQKNKLVHDEESPSCPLCEQNLSASRKRFLKKKFEDETGFLMNRLNRLSKLIKKIKAILIDQHAQLELLKKQEQEQQVALIKIQELNKAIDKIELEKKEQNQNLIKFQELYAIVQNTLHAEQRSLQQLLQSSKHELETTNEYSIVQKKITGIEQKLALHSYDKSAHDKAAHALAQVEQQLADCKQLQDQALFQDQKKEQIKQLCNSLKQIKQQLAVHIQTLTGEQQLSAQEKILALKKHEIERAMADIAKHKEQLLREKGGLENQQQKLEQVKQEYTQQQKELKICQTTIDDYQAIALATGKDGIQALLIEDAIPEIEHEANDLLAKLTDNQTQLFIESLRDLKKGGTKETLDIKISDAAGIRPYELFSGGEAFRIDFALRIAISKLLARRAGTSLQTLIIDEGFGSQDEEGLSHIMDALYKIQEYFSKIIIVSHLSSMKNQFPVHFVIEKGPNGSMVEVMEQG